MPPHLLKLDTTPDLVEQVYRRLLDAISQGTLAPSQRITQEEIAAQLSVSRQPVHQAFRQLKKDGFVLDAPGRGVLVAPLDSDLLLKVYQVRGALDALAARLAAEKFFRIDPELIANGRKAAKGKDVMAMIDADMAFHQAIYEASGNDLIAQASSQHWYHLRRTMGAVLQQSRQRGALWDEHERIADAIAAGRGDLAAQLIEEHAAQASKNLAARLDQVITAGQLKAQAPDTTTSTPHSRRHFNRRRQA
ncbi:MAG: GntR family transcriptional regulator [Pseudomonadota bacterium]